MTQHPHQHPLDETARRRSTFVAGVPIVLGDGQAWHLPRPTLGFFPDVDDAGKIRFGDKMGFQFGADYDALVDALAESEDGLGEANALLALAVNLLLRNYSLTFDDFRVLLPRFPGDPENAEMWKAIAALAVGSGPKPTPVG